MKNAMIRPRPPAAAAYGASWFTTPPSTVEATHGAFDAFRCPALDGVRHRLEQRVERRTFVAGELAKHVVGEVGGIGRKRSDADPEPRVILPPQRSLDALQAVVAATRPGTAEPEASR